MIMQEFHLPSDVVPVEGSWPQVHDFAKLDFYETASERATTMYQSNEKDADMFQEEFKSETKNWSLTSKEVDVMAGKISLLNWRETSIAQLVVLLNANIFVNREFAPVYTWKDFDDLV